MNSTQQIRRHFAAASRLAALPDDEPDLDPPIGTRKRSYRDVRATSRRARVSLIDDGDMLRWTYEPPPIAARRRRARAVTTQADGEVIDSFEFLEVPPNQVIAGLEALDQRLTPHQGLRFWDGEKLSGDDDSRKKRVLLLVHGTFSKSDMFFDELKETEEGVALLDRWSRDYRVMAFDHPTLSMTPWINAIDLQAAMAGIDGPIDVVCHSRGGLVVAWWLFLARPKVKNVVFVGSPLGGTSLAAPSRLKDALDVIATMASVVGTASTAVPMLAAAGGLMKFLGGVLSVGANTPLLDAGVVMVPGLASQSRVSNNFELQRLFAADWIDRFNLHAVGAHFRPDDTDPLWKVWRYFSRLAQEAKAAGAELVFKGRNDLVVDTPSMWQLGKAARITSVLDLSSVKNIHHCSYFRQKQTVDFLGKVLKR